MTPADRDARRARGERDSSSAPGETSRWEWAVGIVGALMFLALLSWLGWLAAHPDRRPPDVSVRVGEVQRVSNGWIVEFEARNDGGQVASQVRVTGKLHLPGAEPEEQEAVLDYVPTNSTRRGGLFFRSDPSTGRLELRASGYAEP